MEVVPCGGRQKAYEAFRNAVDNSVSGILPLLLVDSEGPVSAPPPAHLTASESWAFGDTEGTRVHLMIQAMETWIVADAEAVASYYRQKFVRCLPKADDLEHTPKATIAALLSRATMHTQKGEYHKTRHAPDLLGRLDEAPPSLRCYLPFCDRYRCSGCPARDAPERRSPEELGHRLTTPVRIPHHNRKRQHSHRRIMPK